MEQRENFDLSDEFIAQKKALSNWIINYLNKNFIKSPKILSVGFGTGLVELPLIQGKFDIDLQECQDKSISFMKKRYPEEFKRVKLLISEDLRDIESESYDVVMAITSTYPLGDNTLREYLRSVERILKKGGIFLWYDNSYTFANFLMYIYWMLRKTKHAGIMWGWKRSISNWNRMAAKENLRFVNCTYFDVNNTPVNTSALFKLPLDNKICWQLGIYQKND